MTLANIIESLEPEIDRFVNLEEQLANQMEFIKESSDRAILNVSDMGKRIQISSDAFVKFNLLDTARCVHYSADYDYYHMHNTLGSRTIVTALDTDELKEIGIPEETLTEWRKRNE